MLSATKLELAELAKITKKVFSGAVFVEADIVIPVLPKLVFDFMCDPERMALLGSSTVRDSVENLPGGLHRIRTHYTRSDGVVVRYESEGIESALHPNRPTYAGSSLSVEGGLRD